MLIVVAPAAITARTTSARNSGSVREASSGLNCTSLTNLRAYFTCSTAWRTISSLAFLSLNWRWMALVARKTWIRARSPAGFSAAAQASMSPLMQRASPAMRHFLISAATFLTASKSPGDAAGKPASMMSTFSFSSCRATCSFSCRPMLAPGHCSPSRSVVSKMITWSGFFIIWNFLFGCFRRRQA